MAFLGNPFGMLCNQRDEYTTRNQGECRFKKKTRKNKQTSKLDKLSHPSVNEFRLNNQRILAPIFLSVIYLFNESLSKSSVE